MGAPHLLEQLLGIPGPLLVRAAHYSSDFARLPRHFKAEDHPHGHPIRVRRAICQERNADGSQASARSQREEDEEKSME